MYNDPQWNSPDGWSIYLHTADVKATFDAAIAAGATSVGRADGRSRTRASWAC